MFFFFQAEDGIRDSSVTGVQTCALPISRRATPRSLQPRSETRQYGWGRSAPTDSWPTLRSPCGLLDSTDGAFHQISHQRNLVGIELQWNRSQHGELSRPLASRRITPLATNRIFDCLQP